MMDMPTSHSSEIEEVLAATSARAFFGPNKKRAAIKYRRLARALHPDMGGDETAMAKLNALWGEYDGGVATSGKRKPSEVTRSRAYVVLSEDGHWLVVERKSGGTVPDTHYHDISDLVEGTPVCTLKWTGSVVIAQSDGAHVAFRCEYPETVKDDLIMLSSLQEHLHDGVLHPADLAWITKRVLFLCAAMRKKGLWLVGDAADCIGIAPSTHMLCLVTPWLLSDPPDLSVRHQREVLKDYLSCAKPMIGDDLKSQRIRKFIEGALVDNVTEFSALLAEFNELLVELFDGFHFHKMEVKL